MLESSQFTPGFVTLEYCCYFMRFSEQNEPYGGPTRWGTNKIGSFRGGGRSGLYPSECRAFRFLVSANQPRRNAFRSLFATRGIRQTPVATRRQNWPGRQAARRLCNLVAQSPGDAERGIQTGSRERTDGSGGGAVEDHRPQAVPEPSAVIDRAIETAALMPGRDRSRGYCLEKICADSWAGANVEVR
jgi:hypothetical protein